MNRTTIMPEAARMSTMDYASNLADGVESEIAEQHDWARRAIKTAREAGLDVKPSETVFAARHAIYAIRRVAEMSGLDVRRVADDVLVQLSQLELTASAGQPV